MKIPFNKPYMSGKELEYIRQAHVNGHLSGNGPFTLRCHGWLERNLGTLKALLVPSGTAALEMAAILLDLGPGDEVIMPSFTFVSTANAIVLKGGIPVFVDIRPDTLNLDEEKIEEAITPKTRAIVVIHYAGVACEMDKILMIAKKHGLRVIEDAAQAIGSKYKGRFLGNLGALSALSFHETKNIHSGEGGALLVNEPDYLERAEIIREKGTNRSKFLKGQVDKYTWVDVGSSYLPSELVAAFLWAQLEDFQGIMAGRMSAWMTYHQALKDAEKKEWLRRPVVPSDCQHNAHTYYILLPTMGKRDDLLAKLNRKDIMAVFHYIPLHSSPAGRKYGKAIGDLSVTDEMSGRLIRLPLWTGMEKEQSIVVEEVLGLLKK